MWPNACKIFSNDLAAITFEPRKIEWNKLTIVCATLVDLSKRHMYWFHYEHKKANFKTLVLNSNTDSFNDNVHSENLCEYFEISVKKHKVYDFSNYNEHNWLYSKHQIPKNHKFGNEKGGKIKYSIIAENSKLYSILNGDKQKLSTKRTTKYAQKSVKHWVFFRSPAKDASLRTLIFAAKSESHNIYLTNHRKSVQLFRW